MEELSKGEELNGRVEWKNKVKELKSGIEE